MALPIPYISASSLSSLILASHPSLRIIDVRDHDHLGGHISTSTHHPSSKLSIPKLLELCNDAQMVVFHCALSQQRGPMAARAYAEARRKRETHDASVSEQKLYVLEKGFVGWQEIYGEDKRLTEGYVKDIWKNGYS